MGFKGQGYDEQQPRWVSYILRVRSSSLLTIVSNGAETGELARERAREGERESESERKRAREGDSDRDGEEQRESV